MLNSANPLTLSQAQQCIIAQMQSHTTLLLLTGITDWAPQLLKDTALLCDGEYINVSLELAKHIRQRAVVNSLEAIQLLRDRLASLDARTLFLDRLEILFTPVLQLDVLRLLLELNRNVRTVAVWPGAYQDNQLTYATPDHPEYRAYLDPEMVFPVTILALRR